MRHYSISDAHVVTYLRIVTLCQQFFYTLTSKQHIFVETDAEYACRNSLMPMLFTAIWISGFGMNCFLIGSLAFFSG